MSLTPDEIHNRLFILADKLSDVINPVLLAFIAEEPLRLRELRRTSAEKMARLWPDTWRLWGRSLLCIGGAVGLAELGKTMQVWPGHPNFPSGHTALAASAATVIVLHRGRAWLWITTPLVLLMGAALIYGHWHTPDEVAGALLLGPSLTYFLWKATEKRSKPSK